MKKVLSFLLIATLLLGTFIIPSSALEQSYIVVIGDNVNIRKGPGTQYAVSQKATYGDEFIACEIRGNWVRINNNNEWISADYAVNYQTVIFNPNRKVKVSSGSLTARKAPTTAAPAVGSLANNTNVRVLAETLSTVNGYTWVMIEYGSGVAWVASSYLVNR